MKLPIYALFWTVLAPVLFLTVLSILIYPIGLAANAAWPEMKPVPIKAALWSYGLVSLGLAGLSVRWVWRKFRASLSLTADSAHE